MPDFAAALTGDASGLRIGVEREHHSLVEGFDPACRDRFENAVCALEATGAEIVEVHFDGYPLVAAASMITVAGESLAYHLKDLQSRFGDYGRAARAALSMGAFYTAADYVQAQRVRAWGLDTLRRVLGECDVIITPTIGVPAPKLTDNFWAMMPWTYTPAWNLLGVPAMSVPMGPIAEGMPSGLQIIGGRFDDATVLRVADAYQHVSDWHTHVPDLIASAARG